MVASLDDTPDILEQVHQQAVRTPIAEVAESLQRLLDLAIEDDRGGLIVPA